MQIFFAILDCTVISGKIFLTPLNIQCTMVRRGDKTYLVILSYYNIFGLLGNF